MHCRPMGPSCSFLNVFGALTCIIGTSFEARLVNCQRVCFRISLTLVSLIFISRFLYQIGLEIFTLPSAILFARG